MHHSFHVRKTIDENQKRYGTGDYDDLTIEQKIFYQKKQNERAKSSRFQNPKTTRAQELKEKRTHELLTERKMKEEKEQLAIELRQQKIQIEQQRIKPTLRRIKSTMSSLNTLTKMDQIKSVEKRYKEWLLLKEQEHALRQTMLAKLSGDYTTFSIEKAMNIYREQERLEAEKEEEQQPEPQQQVTNSQQQSQEQCIDDDA